MISPQQEIISKPVLKKITKKQMDSDKISPATKAAPKAKAVKKAAPKAKVEVATKVAPKAKAKVEINPVKEKEVLELLTKKETLILLKKILSDNKKLKSNNKKNQDVVDFSNNLLLNIKKVELSVNKNMKNKRIKTENSNNVNGFMKEIKISNELREFTKWEADKVITRVDITRFLCNYIKENNLQNPENRIIILPDAKLMKILNKDNSFKDDIKYNNMQKLIQKHIIKI